ncbi:IS1 family transposase [Spirosoma endophyticum]|uniref:IS1 family transposase n=1 Tax=Spirosoma endophyticum TaxID=662367 RepID=UPI000B82DF06
MWVLKNSPAGCDGRPLPWVEDAVTGEIIAFVFGRRTHQTFRHLLSLLKQAKIVVIRWITDSWCQAAVAGLF